MSSLSDSHRFTTSSTLTGVDSGSILIGAGATGEVGAPGGTSVEFEGTGVCPAVKIHVYVLIHK